MTQNPYVVRLVVLQTGERLPILCARSSGIPLYEPTLYALTELRARNRSAATIQQALRSVMVLYLVFDGLKIDLRQRFHDGRLLELGEIEQIVRRCHETVDEVVVNASEETSLLRPKVTSLEKARMRSTAATTQTAVAPQTAAIRIHYIRAYLEWITSNQLLKWGAKNDLYSGLKTALELVLRALDARTPGESHRNTLDARMGLAPEALARLLEVIEPISPDNPWRGPYLQMDLIEMADVNFEANTEHAFQLLCLREARAAKLPDAGSIRQVAGNGDVAVLLCTEVTPKVIKELLNWPAERLAVYSPRPDTVRQRLESQGITVNSYSLLDALLRGQTTARNPQTVS